MTAERRGSGRRGDIAVLEKAERLIREGRVIPISDYMFYVIGDHGKYFVKRDAAGVSCNCPGFRRRGFCSHSVAVLLLLLREDYREILSEAERRRLEANLEYIKAGKIPR